MKISSIEDDDNDLQFSAGRFVSKIKPEKKRRIISKKSIYSLMKYHELHYEKGFIYEKLFIGLVNKILSSKYIPNLISIRKATRNQDKRHQVDFWLKIRLDRPINYQIDHEIALQLKSSMAGAYGFIKEFGDKFPHIHVIVINNKCTLVYLVDDLMKIIQREQKRLGI